MTDTPNVLVVILDSVRARNCSLYGYHRETTPFLDEFAAECVTYEQARAPGSWSYPSHVSLFTGVDCPTHGMYHAERPVERGHVFREAADHGYRTAVFSDNPFVSMVDNGLRNGFDHVSTQTTAPFPEALNPVSLAPELDGDIERWSYLRAALQHGRPLRSLANGILWKLDQDQPSLVPRSLYGGIYTTGRAHVDAFLDWAAGSDDPFAAVVNAMDAHSPYDPDSRFDKWSGDGARRVRDRVTLSHGVDDSIQWAMGAHEAGYDGAIRGLDAALETLVEGLREAGVYEDTLLVVTADHGEGFGEPSPVTGAPTYLHGQSVHEALLHVPLLVKPPGGGGGGETVSTPASVTRVADAVRATVSGSELPSFVPEDGPVLALSIVDDTEHTAAYVVDDDRLLKHVFAEETHVFTEHVATPWCAYEVDADPTFADVVGDVGTADVAGEDAVEVDAGVERRLEELGYR